MKRTLAILAGIAVLALALTSTAGAADGTLAAIGQKSSTASLAFTKCQTRACKVRTGTVFLKADTQFLNHVMARAKAGAIRPGTPCFRAALRLSKMKPGRLVGGWMGLRVSDRQFIDAQIRFLEQAVRVAGAC